MILQGYSLLGRYLPWFRPASSKVQGKNKKHLVIQISLLYMLSHYWLSFPIFLFLHFFSVFPLLLSLPPTIFIFFFLLQNFVFTTLSCQLQKESRLCLVQSFLSLTLHVIIHHLTVCHLAPGLDWLRRDQTPHLCSVLLPSSCQTLHVCHRAMS